jgi:hypothetical protein
MNKVLLATLVGVSLTTSAIAAVRDPKINKHLHHEAERIGQGMKSGELTKGETKDLVKDQREIRREERQYKSDGKFTKDELKDVREDQRDASKEIHEEKHDEQARPKAEQLTLNIAT